MKFSKPRSIYLESVKDASASRNVMEGKTSYKASKCYKVIRNNFGEGDFYTSIPQFYLPFLLDDIMGELKKGYTFEPLVYPKL